MSTSPEPAVDALDVCLSWKPPAGNSVSHVAEESPSFGRREKIRVRRGRRYQILLEAASAQGVTISPPLIKGVLPA
jgi:hypothetical protein